MEKLLINIPFEGFYCSLWSDVIDSEERQFVEYEATEGEDGENRFPPELRLSESEIADILMKVTDYSEAHRRIARAYCGMFSDVASEALGFALGLEFESMDSPREYNFATDRVYAFVASDVAQALFDRSAAENHSHFAATIRRRFTSCDGFMSHYSNQLADWLEKPLADWDHNELGTLLLASLDLAGADSEEMRWSIYYPIAERGYEHWEAAVDWSAFELERNDARQEKREEILEADPEHVFPIERDTETLDLFAVRS